MGNLTTWGSLPTPRTPRTRASGPGRGGNKNDPGKRGAAVSSPRTSRVSLFLYLSFAFRFLITSTKFSARNTNGCFVGRWGEGGEWSSCLGAYDSHRSHTAGASLRYSALKARVPGDLTFLIALPRNSLRIPAFLGNPWAGFLTGVSWQRDPARLGAGNSWPPPFPGSFEFPHLPGPEARVRGGSRPPPERPFH